MTENNSQPLTAESFAQPAVPVSTRSPFAAAFGSPVPAAAYAIPAAISTTFALAILAYGGPVGTLLVIDGRYAQLGDTPLPVVAVAAVVALLGNLFGLSAATTAVADRVAGDRRGVAAYWAAAARRPARLLAAALVSAMTAVPFVLVAIGLAAVESPQWLTLVMCALVLLLIVPIVLAVPLTILLQSSPLAAMAGSWRLVQRMEPRRPVRARLFVSVVAAASVLWGAWNATGLLGQSPGARLLGDVGLAAVAVVAVLLCTAVTTGVVLDSLPGDRGADVAAASSPRAGRRVSLVGAVLLVVAVVLPGGLVAASVSANPVGLTRTAVTTVGDTWTSTESTPLGDDGSVSISPGSPFQSLMSVCLSATCEHSSIYSYYATAMGALDDGNVVTAQWESLYETREDPLVAQLLVTVSTPEQLAAVEVEENSRLITIPGSSAVVDSIDGGPRGDDRSDAARLAVDTTGEFPVIASIDTLASPGADARLAVHRCLDADCGAVETVEQALPWSAPYTTHNNLDLAVTQDGTAFVTVISDTDGSQSRLVSFPEAGTPVIVELDRVNSADGGSRALRDENYGAQVVATGPDTAAVLYRPWDVATPQLFVCTVADCTASPIDFPEQSADARPSVAFAVDSTGVPLIAAHDPSTGSVVVLSCIDASCAGTESRVVAHDANPAAALSLTVDRQDRPLVTTGNFTRYSEPEEYGPPSTIIRCASARCGAE